MLDSSAIIALILGEAGAEIVAKDLDDAMVSMVNIAEVYAIVSRKIQNTRAVDAFFALKGVKPVPLSFEQAKSAGLYESIGKIFGLSLGDRCCLALAAEKNAVALTADTAWAKIGGSMNVEIRLIR